MKKTTNQVILFYSFFISLKKISMGYRLAFELNLKHLCKFCFVVQLGAFVLCILITLIKDFQEANNTHCLVKNFLPSISASVSEFFPQNTLWRLAIGVDSFPRYLIAFMYYRHYLLRRAEFKNVFIYSSIVQMAFMFHFIELTSLLLLTYVSSVEYFEIHATSFILFLISSTIYMVLTISTHYLQRRVRFNSAIAKGLDRELKSHSLKSSIFLFYLISILASLYFYIRHNQYCESYVYSMFSLFEYLTVLANIAYHMVIFYDLNLIGNRLKLKSFQSNKSK
jgi:hypothetical protein